ncbi:MAG: hypothetical protein ACJ77K_03515 [Bacteroidia bacterium]
MSAQKDFSFGGRLGVIGCYDYSFYGSDKLLKQGIIRKGSAGISISNRDHDFILFGGVGIKGFKVDVYSPEFQDDFLDDVSAHYTAIPGNTEDSLIGAIMNTRSLKRFGDCYAHYFHAGFFVNSRYRPGISFYYGKEEHLLHADGFIKFEDPQNGDINYVGLLCRFYEIKAGFSFPYAKMDEKPLALNLNIGYKWMDYGNITFGQTDLSEYTTGHLANKYNRTGKFTVSLVFMIWSNWGDLFH